MNGVYVADGAFTGARLRFTKVDNPVNVGTYVLKPDDRLRIFRCKVSHDYIWYISATGDSLYHQSRAAYHRTSAAEWHARAPWARAVGSGGGARERGALTQCPAARPSSDCGRASAAELQAAHIGTCTARRRALEVERASSCGAAAGPDHDAPLRLRLRVGINTGGVP